MIDKKQLRQKSDKILYELLKSYQESENKWGHKELNTTFTLEGKEIKAKQVFSGEDTAIELSFPAHPNAGYHQNVGKLRVPMGDTIIALEYVEDEHESAKELFYGAIVEVVEEIFDVFLD